MRLAPLYLKIGAHWRKFSDFSDRGGVWGLSVHAVERLYAWSALTKEPLGVSATEGDLVLGEFMPQSLVLLLQRMHGRPRPSRHTTAYIAVKCIVGKLPHQK